MTLFIILIALGAVVVWSLISGRVSINIQQIFVIIYFFLAMAWIFAVGFQVIKFV